MDYSGHDIALRDNAQPRYFCHPYLQQQQRRSNATTSSSVIQILLEASPEAASYSHPRTGRIPLHFAILSGKSWHEGVCPMLEVYPDGIMVVDSVTGLYPFMLAASVGSSEGNIINGNDNESTKQLDSMPCCASRYEVGVRKQADLTMIFCLLRRNPNSLLWSKFH